MKKSIILFLICIFLMGCSSDTTNLQNQINDLQTKNEKLIKENEKLKANSKDFIPEDTEEFKLLSTNSCYNANLGDSVETIKNIQGLEFEFIRDETNELVNLRTIDFKGKFLSYDCEYYYRLIEDKLVGLIIAFTDEGLLNFKNTSELNVNLWDLFNSVYGETIYEKNIFTYSNNLEFMGEWNYNGYKQQILFNYESGLIYLILSDGSFDFSS